MTPVEVRAQLTDALRLDLGGPGAVLGAEGEAPGDAHESLLQRPSTWSLPLIVNAWRRLQEGAQTPIEEVTPVHQAGFGSLASRYKLSEV